MSNNNAAGIKRTGSFASRLLHKALAERDNKPRNEQVRSEVPPAEVLQSEKATEKKVAAAGDAAAR